MLCLLTGCNISKTANPDAETANPQVDECRETFPETTTQPIEHYQFSNGMIILTDEDMPCEKTN
jgi:hypothetical protein